VRDRQYRRQPGGARGDGRRRHGTKRNRDRHAVNAAPMRGIRGQYPGVYKSSPNAYCAKVWIDGELHYLGSFPTPEAVAEYVKLVATQTACVARVAPCTARRKNGWFAPRVRGANASGALRRVGKPRRLCGGLGCGNNRHGTERNGGGDPMTRPGRTMRRVTILTLVTACGVCCLRTQAKSDMKVFIMAKDDPNRKLREGIRIRKS
jgi:hypothetical protein